MQPARGATVEFRDVSKQYGESPPAVDQLRLSVPAGTICALVGPSGCGKTTSLKMVNRLVEPTSGDVLIDGQSVLARDVVQLRRGIGYVIQHVGLFPHRTVAQNVATVPHLLQWPRSRVSARVDELLAMVGLEPATVRDRYPSQLSGGERQRVGVARALAVEPPVLLMDEPFGAVDPIQRGRLQVEFKALQQRLGTTVLLVTHDIDEAILLGDHIAVLQRGGVLAQFAPPEQVLARPASDFVAEFVGADRALKRLALLQVDGLEPGQAATIHLGEVLERVPADPWVVVLDAEQRPRGWIASELLRQSWGDATVDTTAPLLPGATSLRDALSMMLASATETGIVVDDDGRYRGVIDQRAITLALRRAPAGDGERLDPGAESSLAGAGGSP